MKTSPNSVETAAIAQFMKDLQISRNTAAFIHEGQVIPSSSTNYPEGTPYQDLVNIKVKTVGLSKDDADELVKLELGVIQEHTIQAENVYV